MEKQDSVWVIISNTTEVPAMFSDHLGTSQTLNPIGQKGSSVQYDIPMNDRYQDYLKRYEALQAVPSFRIVFSGNAHRQHTQPKLVVTPNPVLDPKIANLQQAAKKAADTDRLAQARLARLKAEQAINARPVPIEETKETIKMARVPKLPEIMPAPETVINDLVEKQEGVDLTEESLSKMELDEVKDIATRLDIKVTKKSVKENLIKDILSKV
jgi:hypothetical protein